MRMMLEKYKIYGFGVFISFIFNELKSRFWTQLIYSSYSQDKEDLIIDRVLNYKKKGFYVDVGAYDPYRFNNTLRFYKRGWTGINIEPDKNNFEKFNQYRKRDINLNIGIGDKDSELFFYKFFPDTLSTFSSRQAYNYQKFGYRCTGKYKVKVQSLASVLNEYCKNKKIDLLSVDTEGYDLKVLQSNNWNKFKPKVICIETAKHTKKKTEIIQRESKIEKFLKSKDYKKILDNGINSIYAQFS